MEFSIPRTWKTKIQALNKATEFWITTLGESVKFNIFSLAAQKNGLVEEFNQLANSKETQHHASWNSLAVRLVDQEEFELMYNLQFNIKKFNELFSGFKEIY